jgi:hypothetical protein
MKRTITVVLAALLASLLMFPAIADEPLVIDFEDGTVMGFDVRGTERERELGTGVLTATTEEARSGQYSLLITERRNNWNGPALNVIPYIVPGVSCEISVWVLPKTPDSATFTLSTQIRESGADYINMDTKIASKTTGWTELKGQYVYGEDEFITVYVESSSADAEFYIDDFTLTVSGEAWDPAEPITSNRKGEYDGFDYEFWLEKQDHTGSMTLTGGGTFTCMWEDAFALIRTGKRLGSVKSYKDYGTVILEYGAEHNITKGNVSYLCMYGWTEDPMIEFYIVENHGDYKPPGGKGYQGSYTMDGSTYELYVDTRVEQPSIQGKKTFEQYFAVRTDLRTEGTITISDHFQAWDNLGLDMSGVMYEVSLCVEGFYGAGNANIYHHALTIGDEVFGAPMANPIPAETEPPASEPEDSGEPAATEDVSVASETPPAESAGTESGGFPWIPVAIGGAVVIAGGIAFLLTKKRK